MKGGIWLVSFIRDGAYPCKEWSFMAPEEAGLSVDKLEQLQRLVQGRGCVVRHGCMVYTWGDPARSGDIASAFKPVLSTLLLFAVQEGRIGSVDDNVADFEPALKELNAGKDSGITWRHLGSQTSGYGLAEGPGEAYSYNDYALALYSDVLLLKVFNGDRTKVLKETLGDVLGFQDPYTFEAFGPEDRPGRMAISARDMARFGLFYLRGGRWQGRQVLREDLIKMALSSPIPADMPQTCRKDADMLPNQRSIGGTKYITTIGPGCYSFNWWLNGLDLEGRRLWVDAPMDTYMASGHGSKRALWVIPSLDLIVCWNDAVIDDHDACPGNPDADVNRAVRLMREAAL